MSDVNPDDDIESSRAPLLEHLMELRRRLVICVAVLVVGFVITFSFSDELFRFLLRPFKVAAALHKMQETGSHSMFSPDILLALMGLKELPSLPPLVMQSLGSLETFFVRLKISAIGAVALTFPLIAYQIYAFVAPGLYKKERRAFLPFLMATPFLFAAGAALVFYVMMPFLNFFALNQQVLKDADVKVVFNPRIDDYIKMLTTLLLAFGLSFQTPVVLSLLGLAGIVNSKGLRSFRRYAILCAFIIAAVVTPPDPISQLTLAIPLALLYEASIWCVWLLELRRKKDESESVVT